MFSIFFLSIRKQHLGVKEYTSKIRKLECRTNFELRMIEIIGNGQCSTVTKARS